MGCVSGPADVPLAREGGLAADCIDLRWQQTRDNARFVYAHVGVVVAAAHSVCSPLHQGWDFCCCLGSCNKDNCSLFHPCRALCRLKRCVRLQRLMARAKVCPFSSTPGSKVWIQSIPWVDLQGAGGRDAQGSAHCSDRALLGSPLKQHHYFIISLIILSDGKFPMSTACERAGPNEGGICLLWELSDAVDAPPAHTAYPALPPAAVGLQRQLPRLRF